MRLTINLDDRKFQSELRRLATRDIGIAVTWALNDAATDVQQHLQERMKVVFDRPTRFTQRAFGVLKGARPNNPVVEFGERRGHQGRFFLKVQDAGGARPQTGLEKRLALASPLPMMTAIPTGHAKLDSFGNWSSGERNQVMSQLKIGRDVGYSSNETAGSKRRRPKKTARYFTPKHGLAPGVYRRDEPGGIPVRILTFSEKAPRYKPVLRFREETEREFQARLPDHLDRALRKMLEKRR